MKRRIGITLAALSGLLIAAHFLRAGLVPLAILSLLAPFSLLTGHPWATRVVQLLLTLASAEWIRTLFEIATQRRTEGRPWTRLTIILGTIAALNLIAALLIHDRPKPAEDRTTSA